MCGVLTRSTFAERRCIISSMLYQIVRQGRDIIFTLILIGFLAGLSAIQTNASPFESPLPENQIHQPFVTYDTGESAPRPARVESQDIPVIWIILLILLLFIPAAALMAARRR